MWVDGREKIELCYIYIYMNYLKYLEGFVLIEVGDIKVICLVIIEECVLLFMCGEGKGWVIVEYVMILCVIE